MDRSERLLASQPTYGRHAGRNWPSKAMCKCISRKQNQPSFMPWLYKSVFTHFFQQIYTDLFQIFTLLSIFICEWSICPKMSHTSNRTLPHTTTIRKQLILKALHKTTVQRSDRNTANVPITRQLTCSLRFLAVCRRKSWLRKPPNPNPPWPIGDTAHTSTQCTHT